jgi:hypothetical protein
MALEVPVLHKSLHKLAQCGEEHRVSDMIAADPKLLGQKDEYGADALSWASRNGRLNVVTSLLNKEADTAARGYLAMKPLHHAVSNNLEDVIKELLNKGADINSTDEMGNTPLHYASKRCGSVRYPFLSRSLTLFAPLSLPAVESLALSRCSSNARRTWRRRTRRATRPCTLRATMGKPPQRSCC